MTADQLHDDDNTRAFVIPTAGAQIAQYKIIEKLGAGGMGDVFRAEDTKLRRHVALKFLSSKFAADDSFRTRFLREAQSAGALNHPNIVTIYEVAESDSQVYIAMELVSGRSLRDLIDSGELDLMQRLDIVLQVCLGLAAAHNAGVIHRDIKPENVLIDRDGRVRILDFGLAKAEGEDGLTQAGIALGTANYMSPEQGQGLELDYRSDIFAVGVLLFEVLTGRAPFRKPNLPATIYAIVNEQPVPLNTFTSNLPEGIQDVVDRAMQKKAEDRYQSMREMADDLGGIIGNRFQTGMSPTGTFIAVPPTPEVKSLAVLHLRNLGSPEDEFLSYGITEDLIVDLTRLGTVRVAPMRSVMKYKESDADLEEIAQKLNVNLILDGSIHKSPTTIRVSAQLVDVRSGENLWAERWEQALENLPQVKRALADGIAQALEIGKTMVAQAQVGLPEAENPRAYENYLRGKFTFDHKQETTDVEIALGLYRQAIKEEPSLVAARAGVAEIFIHQGQLDRAINELRTALTEAERQDAAPDKARIHMLLARSYIRQSAWTEAQTYAEQALQIMREQNDPAGEVQTLGLLIAIAQPQGDFDTALRLFDRVLELSRQLDDQEQVAEALKNMGVVYARKGDLDRAHALYQESLELAKAQENLSLQAACLSNIGNVLYVRGQLDDAFLMYNESLQIHKRLGDEAMAARPTLNMGLIELRRGKYREGLDLLNNAAEIFKASGDRGTHAMTLANISQVRLTIGETDKAIAAATRALEIAREIKHVHAECNALFRLASAHFESREYDAAEKTFKEALGVAVTGGIKRLECHIYLHLATLYYQQDNFDGCREYYLMALPLAREIGDRSALIWGGAYKATMTVRDGLFFAGIGQLRDLAKEAEEIGDSQIGVLVLILLGQQLHQYGKSDKEREEGLAVLRDAREAAQTNGLAPEARWAERILAGLESSGK